MPRKCTACILGNQRRRKQFIQQILIEYHVRFLHFIYLVFSFVRRQKIYQISSIIIIPKLVYIQRYNLQFLENIRTIQSLKLSLPRFISFFLFFSSSSARFCHLPRVASVPLRSPFILLSPISSKRKSLERFFVLAGGGDK